MGLVNVRQDLSFELRGEAEIEHGCVSLIQLFVQFFCFIAELIRVTGHIADNDGIEDRADGAEDEAGEELK